MDVQKSLVDKPETECGELRVQAPSPLLIQQIQRSKGQVYIWWNRNSIWSWMVPNIAFSWITFEQEAFLGPGDGESWQFCLCASIWRLIIPTTKGMSDLIQVKEGKLPTKLLYCVGSIFSPSSYLDNLTPHSIGAFTGLHIFMSNFGLFHFYAKIIWHETNVGYLKLLSHYLFELIKHGWIFSGEDQVIHI